jgi:hypothetical protein
MPQARYHACGFESPILNKMLHGGNVARGAAPDYLFQKDLAANIAKANQNRPILPKDWRARSI